MAFYPTAALREIRDEAEKAARLARMVQIEDEVFQTAAGILAATLDAAHVDPTQPDPPPEWVAELGEKAARQRLAVAKAGWMPRSLAPNFIDVAGRVYTGITRARQHQQSTGPREINAKIALPAPTSASMPGAPEYPEKEVE